MNKIRSTVKKAMMVFMVVVVAFTAVAEKEQNENARPKLKRK